MAVSELEAPQVPAFADLHRALTGRATRKQQVAQSIIYLRFRGHTTEQIREHLAIDEDWLTRGEALIFEAQDALDRELGEGWDLLEATRARAEEMPMGRLIVKMGELMAARVRHAEQIVVLRSGGYRTQAELCAQMGVSEEEYKTADRWLRNAGLTLREDG